VQEVFSLSDLVPAAALSPAFTWQPLPPVSADLQPCKWAREAAGLEQLQPQTSKGDGAGLRSKNRVPKIRTTPVLHAGVVPITLGGWRVTSAAFLFVDLVPIFPKTSYRLDHGGPALHHRIVKVGKDLEDHQVQASTQQHHAC